jgi:hypothetical protein
MIRGRPCHARESGHPARPRPSGDWIARVKRSLLIEDDLVADEGVCDADHSAGAGGAVLSVALNGPVEFSLDCPAPVFQSALRHSRAQRIGGVAFRLEKIPGVRGSSWIPGRPKSVDTPRLMRTSTTASAPVIGGAESISAPQSR